jgi:hypothetical protein
MEAPAVAYQIPLRPGDLLLATGDLESHPLQLRRIFRIVARAEKRGIEILPCPSVMEEGKLAQECQLQDERSAEGNIRRNEAGWEVTDSGISCQRLLQAPRLAAKVGCLGIHLIALKGLSSLKGQLHSHSHSHSEEEVRSPQRRG